MYDPPSPRARAARALRPPSWYAARSAHGRTADAPEPDPGEAAPRAYLTRLARPFDDPYEELCRSFNVRKSAVTLLPDGSVPPTVRMPVRRDAHMPTHALVVLPPSTAVPSVTVTPASPAPSPASPSFPSAPSAPVLPVNADLFAHHFSYDLARLSADDASATGSTLPVPFYASSGVQCVELPAIALSLPHPPSAALLLFFGLGLPPPAPSLPPSPSAPDAPEASSRRRSGGSGLDTHTGLFAAFVLPAHVIAEFPSAPAMASALLRGAARAYPTAAHSDSGSSAGSGGESDEGGADADGDGELGECTAFVGGLWANVLALGPRDGRIVDMVRCAWNVCREARRLRELWARGRAARRAS